MNDLIPEVITYKDYLTLPDDNYKYEAQHFKNWLDEKGYNDIGPETVKEYINGMLKQHVPTRTVNKRLSAIKKRIKDTFEKTPASMDVVKQYHLNKELGKLKGGTVQNANVGTEKLISKEQHTALMECPDLPADVKYIAEFMYKCGSRITETLTIRCRNIKIGLDTEGRSTAFYRLIGKNNKERTLRTSKRFYDKLTAFFHGTEFLFEKETGKTFTRGYVTMRILRHSREVLGVDHSAHDYRHTLATGLIHKTKKIKAVSEYLGHSGVEITLNMYVHETLSNDELGLEY
jgi:site-specific recombinase XerD